VIRNRPWVLDLLRQEGEPWLQRLNGSTNRWLDSTEGRRAVVSRTLEGVAHPVGSALRRLRLAGSQVLGRPAPDYSRGSQC
jgi:hypothetical protein